MCSISYLHYQLEFHNIYWLWRPKPQLLFIFGLTVNGREALITSLPFVYVKDAPFYIYVSVLMRQTSKLYCVSYPSLLELQEQLKHRIIASHKNDEQLKKRDETITC